MATSKIHKPGWEFVNVAATVDWINGAQWTAPTDGILTIIVADTVAEAAARIRDASWADTVLTCTTGQFGTGNPTFVGSCAVRAGHKYEAINVSSTVQSMLARFYALV